LSEIGKKEIAVCGQEYVLLSMSVDDLVFRTKVVHLILSKDTKQALTMLSQNYNIVDPKLKVGMPKRYSKNPACYVAKTKTIHVSRREILYNPHVILHEFYHHLRSVTNAQGGIEKYANQFATNYIQAYKNAATINAEIQDKNGRSRV
jgi:hypothetical protein